VARGDRHHRWKRLEIPKSAGFRYEVHTSGEGCLTVAYLPEAFMFSPAIRHSTELSFLCMPPTWWLDAQAARLARFGEDARRAALATYFAALLDQRTALPIAADTRFHLRLFEAACEESWVLDTTDRPRSFAGWGLEQMGFEEPLLCAVSHVEFADFLAGVTSRHLPKETFTKIEKELPHGTSRIPSPGRVLPDAVASAVQLVLPGFAAPEPVRAAGAV
jgi:hypothetical protein